MPSAKILEEKKAIVKEVVEKLSGASSAVVVDYKGITVEQDTKLRSEMRKADVEYFVIKNTLLRFVVRECGYEALVPALEKMTAIAISQTDPVAPAKILKPYADKIPTFNLKAGVVDGAVIGVDAVEQLASLPSKEELIAKLMGSLNAPISGLVNVLNGNIRGLACVLKAIAEKKAE